MIKAAFASMGKNLRTARAAASGTMSLGRSYLRWAAAGGAAGAIQNLGSNITSMGGEDRTSLMTSIKRGAMIGLGARGIKGVHAGAAARRRARVIERRML